MMYLAPCLAAFAILAAGPPGSRADTAAGSEPHPFPKPFFDARQRQTEYAGPGRELPEPAHLTEVLLGYFGPSNPEDPELGDAWRTAQWAVEELNCQGGYRGKPFRLVPGWSDQPWKDGASQVTRMVYGQEVWAVIGGPDGATTHLAEQVAAKARVPVVSPGSTDRTANLANVPWMFSLLPGDHLQAPVLAEHIAADLGGRPLVLLSAGDHDARQFVFEFRRAASRIRLPIAWHFVCSSAETAGAAAARAVAAQPSGVLVVGGPTSSATMVTELRRAGYRGPLFGTAAFGRRRFLDLAGHEASGAVFPCLYSPGSKDAWQFAQRFQGRWGHPPDYLAAATYDAVHLLAAGLCRAGLNRARLGDALWELSPWQGACGVVRWDKLGSNTRAVTLGTIRDGRVAALEPAASPAKTGK